MVKAHHPEAGYFTEYIYMTDPELANRKLDVILSENCQKKSTEGYVCESCYSDKLDLSIQLNASYIGLKKFFTYQLGLYDNPMIWLKEFRLWLEHSDANFNYKLENLINDVVNDIMEVESQEPDVPAFISVTNNFVNATIGQVNQGGNNCQTLNYTTVLDQMQASGLPEEIISEGKELLKDADKSDSLKKIAANWIKNLPFRVIEKSGDWAINNFEKLQQHQNDLMTWMNSL